MWDFVWDVSIIYQRKQFRWCVIGGGMVDVEKQWKKEQDRGSVVAARKSRNRCDKKKAQQMQKVMVCI